MDICIWEIQTNQIKIVLSTDYIFNPFPNENALDWSKFKEFAEDNFKLDENGIKFS